MNPESRAQPSAHPPAETPRLRVAAAVVWRGNRLLMTRRPPGGALGLMWEFPGGKLEPGETPEQAIVRELREELDIGATAIERVAVETHEYEHGLGVEITFVACELSSFRFRPGQEVHEIAWRRPADLDLSTVLSGDRDFLIRLGARPVAG